VSLVLFAQNLLETATSVTVTPAALTAKPITRIHDRDRGPQYEGGSAAQTDIDIDLGSAQAVTGWALVNHNITGVTVTLFGDSVSPPTTSRDTIAATGVDFLRTFASLSLRYWRIRIPVMASAPRIGEVLLGVPRTITQNPFVRQSGVVTRGNVRRDLSPAGYDWAVRLRAKRIRLPYGWTSLSEADLDTVEAAFDEVDQGAKHLLVKDVEGTLRWMAWVSAEVNPVPLGNDEYEVAVEREEAL
jgi:hypothetical protein